MSSRVPRVWFAPVFLAALACTPKYPTNTYPLLYSRELLLDQKQGEPNAIKLSKALKEDDWRIAATALTIIRNRRLESFNADVIKLVHSQNWKRRAYAVAALGKLNPSDLTPLKTALMDSHWEVREEAELALAAVGTFEAVRILIEWATQPNSLLFEDERLRVSYEQSLATVPQAVVADVKKAIADEQEERLRFAQELERKKKEYERERQEAERRREEAERLQKKQKEQQALNAELTNASASSLEEPKSFYAGRQPTETWDDAKTQESGGWEADFGDEFVAVAETNKLYGFVVGPGNLGWVKKEDVVLGEALFGALRLEIARLRKNGEIDEALQLLRTLVDTRTDKKEVLWIQTQQETLEAEQRARDEIDQVKKEVPRGVVCDSGGDLEDVVFKHGALSVTYLIDPLMVNMMFRSGQTKVANCLLDVVFSNEFQGIVRNNKTVTMITITMITEWGRLDRYGNAIGKRKETLGRVRVKARTLRKVNLDTFMVNYQVNGANAAYSWVRKLVSGLEIGHGYR